MSDNFESMFEVETRPTLTATVQQDEITEELSRAFDYTFTGTTVFEVPSIKFPKSYGIGLIVGPSGTGKSTLLKDLNITPEPEWDPSKAICSHFETANEASEKLSAVGLNSLPVWMKPYHVLSTGEKFRATMARQLADGATIDEFTSVVDRTVAKSCAYAIRRYVDKHDLHWVTFATCHYDIIEWLQPDWVYDTATGRLSVGRGSLQRPTMQLEILPVTHKTWAHFRDHHYLTRDINISARCWIAVWEGVLVGFVGAISFPGTIKKAWREHRTVVLPEFQGLGFGVRISDAVAELMIRDGWRYFSKTAHPRMGEYRERSPLWKPTSANKADNSKMKLLDSDEGLYWIREQQYAMRHRVCYSHEYIGHLRETTEDNDPT